MRLHQSMKAKSMAEASALRLPVHMCCVRSVVCVARGRFLLASSVLQAFPESRVLLRGCRGERPGQTDMVSRVATSLGPVAWYASSPRFQTESVRGRAPFSGGCERAHVVITASSLDVTTGSMCHAADKKTGAHRSPLQGHSGACRAAPWLTSGTSCCSCALCGLCADGAGSTAACPPGGHAAGRLVAA